MLIKMQIVNVKPYILTLPNAKQLDLSQPQVMGILNVTPDSFSDGGQYQQLDLAVEQALKMQQDGASIIDIGGESTRPNAPSVSLQQELDRVLPVVEALKPYNLILSIDTSQPEVIRQAVGLGASIWNDVRALTRPNALQTAVELDIPVILMHMRGEPDTMNNLANYRDIVAEIKQELLQKIEMAIQAGVKKQHIIADIGFGFAKNSQHNIELLKHFAQFTDMGFPLLSGLSRKRFIGEILDVTQADERVIGSVVGHLFSIQQGANIVRVHDVKATAEAIKIWKAMA